MSRVNGVTAPMWSNLVSSLQHMKKLRSPSVAATALCVFLSCAISFSLLILGTFHTFFPIPILGMGHDVWMRPLGPIAPEGANWMHFPSVTAALRHFAFAGGWALDEAATHPSNLGRHA